MNYKEIDADEYEKLIFHIHQHQIDFKKITDKIN